MCPHTATYVSAYCHICVLILLYMYVSSYCHICVRILLYMCPLLHPHTTVNYNLYMSAYVYVYAQTACQHTAVYVSISHSIETTQTADIARGNGFELRFCLEKKIAVMALLLFPPPPNIFVYTAILQCTSPHNTMYLGGRRLRIL
jgi:hypothetical protein